MANASDPPDESVKPSLRGAIRAVADAMAALPMPSMNIGGIAVIARGVPRLTRDIDLTVAGGVIELPALLDVLRAHGLSPRIDDAIAFAEANQVLLFAHAESGVDVDLSIAWLPFELDALAAPTPLDIAGTRVAVARPEDLIIYKAVAFRPQDQQDIERLLSPTGGASMFHGSAAWSASLRRRWMKRTEWSA